MPILRPAGILNGISTTPLVRDCALEFTLACTLFAAILELSLTFFKVCLALANIFSYHFGGAGGCESSGLRMGLSGFGGVGVK
jgi:hypothetical protein